MIVSLVAIVLLLTGVVRVLQKERNQAGLILAAPLLVTALVESCDCASVFGGDIPWRTVSLHLEALLPSVWLLCSFSYSRDNGAAACTRNARVIALVALLLLAVPVVFTSQQVVYAPDFPVEPLLFLTDVGYYFYVCILVLLVVALTNFEATLVNASPDALWRVKLDIVALDHGRRAGLLLQ
jgi:hypothetical protein